MEKPKSHAALYSIDALQTHIVTAGRSRSSQRPKCVRNSSSYIIISQIFYLNITLFKHFIGRVAWLRVTRVMGGVGVYSCATVFFSFANERIFLEIGLWLAFSTIRASLTIKLTRLNNIYGFRVVALSKKRSFRLLNFHRKYTQWDKVK